jgi:hypothetical protein
MTIEILARQVFKIAESKENVIYPPEQVFINPNFEFLLTIGGHLADGDDEYQKLLKLLKDLGETEFYVLENIGISSTERNVAYQTTVSVDKDFESFDKLVQSFDPPFGFIINHWFVFGKNNNWGIYICEYPTINIIGCTKNLTESFSMVYNITENGFLEQVDFIAQEYNYNSDLLDKLVKNYRLQKPKAIERPSKTK